MYSLSAGRLSATVDFAHGRVHSLTIDSKERISGTSPLFRIGLRDKSGELIRLEPKDAQSCEITKNGARYALFPISGLSVSLFATSKDGEIHWRAEIGLDNCDYLSEWIDFPLISLPRLCDNFEGGGRILYPYNEGALVSDMRLREESFLRYCEPSYPSHGIYSVFPNMVFCQMLGYIFDDAALYIGAHDLRRAPKVFDFFEEGDGVTMQTRLYLGGDFGCGYSMDYPIVWSACEGRWEAVAEEYRAWFEANLPPRVKKIKENPTLPAWYEDSPLVVSYPVRGRHDTDVMEPNALYPYTNGLPLIKEVKKATDAKILTLLMHWEGTAPWAPPYVWPPYGGEDNFKSFLEELHAEGNMLGVYCSGFGYTLESRLTDYKMAKKYEAKNLSRAMCKGPKGEIVSHICTDQRLGLDVCPASEAGRELLLGAYGPLFDSGIDYAQILDQNHGGGQYFCYSRDHGHPPTPGAWMTENMQSTLTEWNGRAKNMLFGCESAAAEPFIGNILYSDNRFELIYNFAAPVPLYNYIYHEYLRNFMGNQVCCPFPEAEHTLCYRIAYSFSIGDSMTLVFSPDGGLLDHWGTREFTNTPDKAEVYTLIRNLTSFYREKAKDYLYAGRMAPTAPVVCDSRSFTLRGDKLHLPALLISTWETEDGRATVIVNPEGREARCRIGKKEIAVPPLNAVLVEE